MDTGPPLTLAFPAPTTPRLQSAFHDLYLSTDGTVPQKSALGDPAHLPRPWDPATCLDPALRKEVWEWLEAVVTWFNHEYVWDPTAGVIPACWPQHPHLVHEIGVLADQRRRSGIATTSDLLEDWHRYTVPAFLDRMRARMKNGCDDGTHTLWPARGRYTRHTNTSPDRRHVYQADLAHLTNHRAARQDQTAPALPTLHLVDDDDDQPARIDPTTGEIL